MTAYAGSAGSKMPGWLKYGLAFALGVAVAQSHGQILVQAGHALAAIFNAGGG